MRYKFRVLYDKPSIEQRANNEKTNPKWHYFNAGSSFDWFLANESTLGLQLPIFDKAGRQIFEGDILEFDRDSWYALSISLGHSTPENGPREVVSFDKIVKGDYMGSLCDFDNKTIIGNVHENPELLNE